MNAAKRIMAVICVFMLMTTIMASAEYSLDQYDEDFVYDSEYVAMALNTATVRIYYIAEAQLTYKQVVYDRSGFVAAYNSEARAYFDTGVTEAEYNAHMAEFTVANIKNYLAYGSEQTLPASTGGLGSGVVISEDGYIATNHHVVEEDDASRITSYLNDNVAAVQDDFVLILQEITEMFDADDISEVLSEEQQEDIYTTLLNSYVESAVISNETIALYVLYPGADGDGSNSPDRMYEAEIVSVGGEAVTVEDAAIIKVNATNMVALELTDTYPAVASSVWTAGFPGVADVNEASFLTATITSGVVSAIKDAENSGYRYIQLDATFAQGNSGGPSVNNKLEVVGLNSITYNRLVSDTYFTETAYYDVPYMIIRDLSSGFNIGMGDVSKTFLLGIQALQQGYGLTAVECFEAVKAAKADTPYIDTYIEQAQKAEQTEMPRGFKLNIDKKTIAIIGGGVLVVVIIVVIILLLTRKKKKPVTSTPSGLDIDWGGNGGYNPDDANSFSNYGSSSDSGSDLL